MRQTAKKRNLTGLAPFLLLAGAAVAGGIWVTLEILEESGKQQRFQAFREENGGRVVGRGCMVMRPPVLPS